MPRSKKSPNVIPLIATQSPAFKSTTTNNILFILLIIIAVFSIYLYLKVRSLEQKIASPSTVNQGQQAPSPLSVDNLKKYAKELGLNTGKFNQCLDSNKKQQMVTAD
jgi:hypothetical protein